MPTLSPLSLSAELPWKRVSVSCPRARYYNQGEVMKSQILRWNNFSASAKEVMEIIIVDDGSKKVPIMDVVEPMRAQGSLPDVRLKVLVLLEDIGFNQNGAINTGSKVRAWTVMRPCAVSRVGVSAIAMCVCLGHRRCCCCCCCC